MLLTNFINGMRTANEGKFLSKLETFCRIKRQMNVANSASYRIFCQILPFCKILESLSNISEFFQISFFQQIEKQCFVYEED